jgi:hypothetical protein
MELDTEYTEWKMNRDVDLWVEGKERDNVWTGAQDDRKGVDG